MAQTRRVLLAKQLIHESDLSMAEVAMASGFGSVRRFNETFQALYGRAPSDLRRRKVESEPGGVVKIGLSYRPPYDWTSMMTTLAMRGVADEVVVEGVWIRRLRADVDGTDGSVTVRHAATGKASVEARVGELKALPGVLVFQSGNTAQPTSGAG
ncbi:MAG: helix-turn-helix domain-containing protein, partial [Rhodoluna sp.]